MASKPKSNKKEVIGLVGIGLDNKDEHQRITRTEEFFLVGGSEETHGKMQDVAIYFNEALREEGKRLQDVPPEQVIDLLHKATDR